MSFLDLFKTKDTELCLQDMRILLNLNRYEYQNLNRILTSYVKNGLFTRRKKEVLRRCGKNGKGIHKKVVYFYKPKEWILNSICNGFYEKNIQKIESEFKHE